MAIKAVTVKITGTDPLLQNNPQTVDPFNHFAKMKKAITDKKRGKTEDDLIELGNVEVESKLFFEKNGIGVYVPATWLTEAIITTGYAVAKIGRKKLRAGIYASTPKIELHYAGKETVKEISDIVMNPNFRHRMLLKQGDDRVPKDTPIFHDWSFETVIEFDDSIVDATNLSRIIKHAAKYGGFGDFRPTFGRAIAEVSI